MPVLPQMKVKHAMTYDMQCLENNSVLGCLLHYKLLSEESVIVYQSQNSKKRNCLNVNKSVELERKGKVRFGAINTSSDKKHTLYAGQQRVFHKRPMGKKFANFEIITFKWIQLSSLRKVCCVSCKEVFYQSV